MQLTKNLARRKLVSKTSRRDLLKVAGVGSLAAGLGINDIPIPKSTGAKPGDKDEHKHDNIDGPKATATVSFGSWPTDPPLDRFPDKGAGPLPPPTFAPNVHKMIPYEVEIKAGGTVNFIIGGFHQVLVYDDGVEKSDINATLLLLRPNTAPLVNDPNKRLYRGIDPMIFPQDRVEVVNFSSPGRYLVICGVLPHFAMNPPMQGYVKVTK
jgi:plastocyanin